MRLAHGDLITGISGDMFVAALLDLGLSVHKLKAELRKIRPLEFRIEAGRKSVRGIRATRFRVSTSRRETDRTWKDIRQLIERSSLTTKVKELGLSIFGRLAEVEGKVHGVPADRVRFHEIGATDSIVDIMAAVIGAQALKIDSFSFSRIPLSRGFGRSRHGPLPMPGPATLELLKGLPVQGIDLEGETVTPTGAAILSVLGSRFGEAPPMTLDRIGYGAGEKEFPDWPNLFRIVMGRSENSLDHEEMVVLETNIDDMNPEIYDYVLEQLFAAGARDVFLTSIQMKKNRPGTLLSIVAEPSRREKLAQIVFRETSTIGVRFYPVRRMILRRVSKTLETRFGRVRVKMIAEPSGTTRVTPEYEDIKRIAARNKIPLKVLYEEITNNFTARRRAKPS